MTIRHQSFVEVHADARGFAEDVIQFKGRQQN